MKVIKLHQNENENIRLAVEQNRQAQQWIYDKFSPKMLSVCRLYLKDLQQAEDIMIIAFMKIFTNLKKFEYKGSFEGWIRRIIINECISFLRVKKKIEFIEEIIYEEEQFNEIESKFLVDDIQHLIDNLPDGCKMVFNLYCIEGFKHQEIAEMLNIKDGTSKSQLSHARKILQHQMVKLKKL